MNQNDENKEDEIESFDSSKKRSYLANTERAARMRASIISLLNSEDQPLSKKEIGDRLSSIIDELDYKTNNFEGILYNLAKNDLIRKLGKNPNGSGSIYASVKYEFPQGKTGSTFPKVKKTYKRKTDVSSQLQLEGVNPVKANENFSPLTVDIIKSTGRIRLSINGMHIEIGVID